MENLLIHSRRPDVSFTRSGLIRISARVAHLLALRPADAVNISRSGSEFLLRVVRRESFIGRMEATCYPSNKHSGHFCAHSARLCNALLDAACIPGHKGVFICGAPVLNHINDVSIPIITKHPL